MKIHDVLIVNWQPPGQEWWKEIEANADQPLLEVHIRMNLSYNEYMELLRRDKAANKPS